MKCRDAKEWMLNRCDGPLGAEWERRLDAHLESCPRCRREAGDIERGRALLAELPLAEPSPTFEWRLRLRLSKVERETGPPLFEPEFRPRAARLEFWGAAAAAAVVVVATGLYLLRPTPDAGPHRTIPQARVVHGPGPFGSASGLRPVSDRDRPIGPQEPIPYYYLFPPEAQPPSPGDSLAPPPQR